MYTSSNLIVYYDKEFEDCKPIHDTLIECDIVFREFVNLKPDFSALKNPENYIILAINNPQTLQEVENIAVSCYNYQKRVFVLFSSNDLIDNFFDNFTLSSNLKALKQYIQTNVKNQSMQSTHSSKLLYKLVCLELQKLEIPTKYIGFKYLAGVIVNSLSNNFT